MFRGGVRYPKEYFSDEGFSFTINTFNQYIVLLIMKNAVRVFIDRFPDGIKINSSCEKMKHGKRKKYELKADNHLIRGGNYRYNCRNFK